ncbi:two-component-system connector protein YcgZ [Superficieibacter electus]|uniref:Two-component-system connector protein YcgZ n=1 Tax=Superficieibacter electus TaxID=2022662 RepID=A0A2P5GQY5_9ENTR|nr:regulatory protein YcgZ [Superficieibacter electus]POP43431.1 two-component-system connector protein YcgZ [Superficieibacter electus]POP48946.1 two-component-system connector protein YcgZ [Superficieibacter electus]
MQQITPPQVTSSHLTALFTHAALPSQQQTLGAIVVDVLCSGRTLNRKAICLKLLARLEQAATREEEQHYQELIGLLFRN